MDQVEDPQRDYRRICRLVELAYECPKPRRTKDEKNVIANLLAGEWVKRIRDVGDDEVKVEFRRGEGYVSRDSLTEDKYLEIYFIDVGQGDAILIQTPDDKRILIDGGGDDRAHYFLDLKYNLVDNEKEFEAIILTHGDADHVNGLLPILNNDNIIVKSIYHNGIAKRRDSPELGRWVRRGRRTHLTDLYGDVDQILLRRAELTETYQNWVDAVANAKARALARGIPFQCVRADQNTPPLVIGEGRYPVYINFLNPINLGTPANPELRTFGSTGETINGNSVGFLLKYRRARIMLCGDMNSQSEEICMAHWGDDFPRAHVFKANHHGSPHFTTEFLRTVKPWVTVVSSGDIKDYGHPRANLLGSLGHYAPRNIKKPLLFSTEIAATFKKVAVPGQPTMHLYEKSIEGIIHLRTNGRWLASGRVYQKSGDFWKWENYAFNLKNGKPTYYDLAI